jgi:hypothetical protein
MSTNIKYDIGQVRVLGTAKVTIATATTTSFDFGTPDDINLNTNANYKPGDRILAIFSGTTAGTTDSITVVVQDAPDSSGTIGTPATAVTSGTLALGTSDGFTQVAVQVQAGRPWLRFRVTSSGATDTFVTHCTVLAVPSNV